MLKLFLIFNVLLNIFPAISSLLSFFKIAIASNYNKKKSTKPIFCYHKASLLISFQDSVSLLSVLNAMLSQLPHRLGKFHINFKMLG